MTGEQPALASRLKELLMRYYPVALALSAVVAVTASVSHGAAPDSDDARARQLLNEGRAILAQGDAGRATDAFEAALAVDPSYIGAYLALGDAARAEGLQGKAIHYYREALEHDPNNFAAISGEGEALLEKGAVDKARRNLAQLESQCGDQCAETRQLAAALQRGPRQAVLTAEAVTPSTVVTQN